MSPSLRRKLRDLTLFETTFQAYLNRFNVKFSTIAVENSNCQKYVDRFSTVESKKPYFTALFECQTVSHSLSKTFLAHRFLSKKASIVEKIKPFFAFLKR